MKQTAPSDVNLIEKEADAEFFSIKPPHPAKDISIWHVLTVAEETLRMPYAGMVEQPPHQTDLLIDDIKYALRHALDHVQSNCKEIPGLPVPIKVNPDVYSRAFKLIAGGRHYAAVSDIFSALHSGRVKMFNTSNGFSIDEGDPIEYKYTALEALSHGREPTADITNLVYHWLRGNIPLPKVAEVISNSTRIKNKQVLYEYDATLATALAAVFPQRVLIIPDDWIFPWGNSTNTHALINSLLLRCVYHILAVNLTASRVRLTGGCDASLVLVISKEQLCEDIGHCADIGLANISLFVDFLTYGLRTSTPDPALQPLIPLANGLFLMPCMHIMTSDVQRNVLSLTTRLDSKAFDKQSHLFEKSMIEHLEEHLKIWPNYKLNKKYNINKKHEEIDVIIADKSSKTALVLELRWMIRPGDPREIANRSEACLKKIAQLANKIRFVESNVDYILADVLSETGFQDTEKEWSILGAVVIEGYGGILSTNKQTPVVTSEILKIGLAQINNLRSLHKWLTSLEWLPVAGKHFSHSIEECIIGGFNVTYPALTLESSHDVYRGHAEESAKMWNANPMNSLNVEQTKEI
jgi:hypothetical protein